MRGGFTSVKVRKRIPPSPDEQASARRRDRARERVDHAPVNQTCRPSGCTKRNKKSSARPDNGLAGFPSPVFKSRRKNPDPESHRPSKEEDNEKSDFSECAKNGGNSREPMGSERTHRVRLDSD